MSEASRVLADDQIVYSADSHVLEPRDLWTRHIDSAFRERAPHVVDGVARKDGSIAEGEFLICEGIGPQRVAAFAAADVDDPRDRAQANQRGYDKLRAGGWDPKLRLEDQDIDGVSLEVLYPSMAMPMFAIADPALQQAVFRAYNDWVAEYAAAAPDRLVAVALLPADEVEAAIAELERARGLGLRGAMIWNDPGPGRSYSDAVFEPLWEALAGLEMPLSLHILTGKTGTGLGRGPFLENYMTLTHPVQRALAALLTSGVFERHPGLRDVSVENDVGWLAHFLYRLDHAHREFRYMVDYKDPLSPTEYFRRHVWATFQDDPVGVQTVDWIGSDRLMWASDYPHGDSTWPDSRATIERNFAGVAPDTVKKITYGNVAELYGL